MYYDERHLVEIRHDLWNEWKQSAYEQWSFCISHILPFQLFILLLHLQISMRRNHMDMSQKIGDYLFLLYDARVVWDFEWLLAYWLFSVVLWINFGNLNEFWHLIVISLTNGHNKLCASGFSRTLFSCFHERSFSMWKMTLWWN